MINIFAYAPDPTDYITDIPMPSSTGSSDSDIFFAFIMLVIFGFIIWKASGGGKYY